LARLSAKLIAFLELVPGVGVSHAFPFSFLCLWKQSTTNATPACLVFAFSYMPCTPFVRVSGIGANTTSPSPYIRSRGEGEAAVQTAFPGAVIVRPAVLFAPGDAFLTTILRLLRSLPAYPIFGDGRTRLQPVYADDVASAIAQILRQSRKPYPVYELAGPRVYSYEELLRTIARIARLRPVLMRMPFAFWDALAGVAEMLPRPPLTRNQVELMQIDTTASESLPGFRALGISPRSLEEELEAILRQNKPRVLSP